MARWLFAMAVVVFAGTSVAPASSSGLSGTTRAGDRPEPHAVVWLDAPSDAPAVQSARVVLDQRNLDFSPHVLAVRVGTVVDFPNNDRVFHNVFSFHNGKRFDLGLYPIGTTRRVTFDHPGLSRIFCNIHPNMGAHVMAVDTPYFSVSDEAGRFAIPSVPSGTYVYHAWRPGRPDLTGSISVGPSTVLDLLWR